MSGSLLQAARNDFKQFIEGGGFEEDITLVTPDGATAYDIKGFAAKHHINFDSDGAPINSKNVHLCIVESSLVALGIQTRNTKGEIALLNWLVVYPDSSGTARNYKVRETLPDETLGGIVMILEDYTPS